MNLYVRDFQDLIGGVQTFFHSAYDQARELLQSRELYEDKAADLQDLLDTMEYYIRWAKQHNERFLTDYESLVDDKASF